MVLTLRHELVKTGMNQIGKNTSALWDDDRKSSQSQGVINLSDTRHRLRGKLK